jgi:hypothetical protein
MSNERSKRPSDSTTIGTRCCTATPFTAKVQPGGGIVYLYQGIR